MVFDKSVMQEIATIAVERYNWENDAEASLIVLSENATYMIKEKSSGKKIGVLRVSRPNYHSLEELESEMLWLRQINDYTPLVVANPIKGSDGKRVQEVIPSDGLTYFCIVCEFLPGSEPDDSDKVKIVSEFEKLGETTAYLHRQANIWNGTSKIVRWDWTFENIIGENAIWGKWQDFEGVTEDVEQYIQKAVKIIQKRLKRYGKTSANWGLIHADLRLANILTENDVIKVIDFDDCGFGWHLHDLASSISFIEHKEIVPDLINAWLRGYKKVLPFTDTDFEEIDTFILMRRLQLMAWLASHKESGPVAELSVGFLDDTLPLVEIGRAHV